ncbi:PAS domain S-box protein [Arcobacteraceae bacterium]|nr:PAS domain S-box protein [Arcobacteraceae bacterium]
MKGTALKAASIYKQYTSDHSTCIIIFETSGLISYANDTFCKLSGYSREELIGHDETILNSNNQSKSYIKSVYEALNNGNIWHDKLKNKTKNGTYYWVDRTIIPFLDSEGKTEMYVNIYVDITHKKESSENFVNDTFAIDQNSIIAKTDNTGTITYVNDNFCDITGYLKEELIGQNHRLLNSDNKPKSYWKKMYQTISSGNIWQDEVKNKTKDGHYYWVDTTIVPHMGIDGKPESYISLRTDITEQKDLSNTLIKHKFAIDQHAIIATTDISGNITYANDKFIEISGYSKEELLGKNHKILNSGNQSSSYWKNMYKNVSQGHIWKGQVKNISKNGSYYWVDTTIIPFMDEDGKPNSYFSIRTDITYQKRIEEILSSQRFAMEQHSIIAITDTTGSITYANDKFCDISGYKEEELIGQNHRILNSTNQPTSYWQKMYKTLEEKGIWQDEVKNISKDGSYYWVDTTIVPLLDSMGNADCYISIRTDITKYKKIQEELKEHQDNLEKIVHERTLELDKANKKLRRLSEIDTLTKLFNRRKLNIDFNRELIRVNRFDRKMALYFLDLDGFKNVNDNYGHDTGDKLLQQVAESTLQLLRENEYLYRIGGDEFCILIPEFTEKKELDTLANRLLESISNIKIIDTFKIEIGCSIGISIFPDNGNTLSDLISEADKAMYLIKKKGKNNYHFHS